MSSEPGVATEVDRDAALVERALVGDGGALDALVSRHLEAVYAVAYRVLEDRDAAADAAQDAFVRALTSLGTFRGEASFRTWLLRIAANTAISAGRRTTRQREVPLEPSSPWLAEGATPERQAVLRTEADRVEAALVRLPEKQRLAVSLRLHEDMTHREIARVLDSSEGAVRVNYHVGIKRLREWLT